MHGLLSCGMVLSKVRRRTNAKPDQRAELPPPHVNARQKHLAGNFLAILGFHSQCLHHQESTLLERLPAAQRSNARDVQPSASKPMLGVALWFGDTGANLVSKPNQATICRPYHVQRASGTLAWGNWK